MCQHWAPPHRHTAQTDLSPSKAAVIKTSWLSAQIGHYFPLVNDDHYNLATSLSCYERVSSFTIIHEGRPCTILGLCPSCIKTHDLLPCLSLTHKHNSSTGVGGNIFFSAEGCYVWSVWGKCERTKMLGFQPAGGFPRSAEERREPWYSWLCRSIYKAELTAHLCSLIDIEIWQWSVKSFSRIILN